MVYTMGLTCGSMEEARLLHKKHRMLSKASAAVRQYLEPFHQLLLVADYVNGLLAPVVHFLQH